MNPVDQQGTLSAVYSSILMHAALKGFVILLLATILTASMRRASAAWRHLIWLLAFLAAGGLPLLSWVLPALDLPILPTQPIVEVSEAAATNHSDSNGAAVGISEFTEELPSEVAPMSPMPASSLPMQNAPVSWTWRQWLLAIWCAGCVLTLSPVLMGLVSLAALRSQYHLLEDVPLERLAAQCAEHLKLRTPVSIAHHRDGYGKSGPMVWGAFRPILALPAECLTWSRRRIEIVLLHELAHVKRNDWLTHAFCAIVCAAHWFNPLAWWAVHRLRLEQERACDDLVLKAGIEGPDYAQHLLSIARDLIRPRPVVSVALAMVRTSQIEKRIRDILEPDKRRQGVIRSTGLLGLIAVTLAVLPLAAVRATVWTAGPSVAFNPVAGRVVDEEGQGIAGVTVAAHLSNSRMSHFVQSVQSDAQGYFEISKVPRDRGEYESCGLSFKREGMVPAWLKNVFELSDAERRNQRVVLLRGHAVSGTLADDRGRPVPGILVEVIPAWQETPAGRTRSWRYRKAAQTDTQGRFMMRGIKAGDYHIQAFDVPSQRKAVTETFAVAEDFSDLNLQLSGMTLPIELHPVDVLGMKVVSLNEVIHEAFGLDVPSPRGVFILDPGKDHRRFDIGSLQPADCFSSVGNKAVHSVADFIGMLLENIPQEYRSDPNAMPFPFYCTVGVSYFFRRAPTTGYRCEGMRLNKEDILALQELYSHLSQIRHEDVYVDFNVERNLAGVMLMSVKAARFAYRREHDRRPPGTLEELQPYLEHEQGIWHNAEDVRIRRQFRQYDFYQWLKENAVLYLAAGAGASEASEKPILGYSHTMLQRRGKTCVIYDDPVLDYKVVEQAELKRQLRDED